jgi:hypothetical protein
MRESLVDAPKALDVGEILRRRDERHRPRLAERRLSDLEQPDAIARRREPPEVSDRLIVCEKL